MIEHAHIQEKLFAYLDFEVDDAERAQIEQHLKTCGDCAAELEITRRANELFQTVEPQPLPEGFMARLQSRIDEGESANQPRASHLSIVPPPVPATPSLPKTEMAPVVSERPRGGGSLKIWGLLAALLAAVIGFTFVLKPSDGENPATAAAALAYSEGDIELQRGSSASMVTQAMALRPGDALVTSANGRAVVTLGNGGSVRLAPSSRMRVVALATSPGSGRLDAKLELEEGAIWVEEVGGVHCALQAGSTLIVPVGTAYEAVLNNGAALVNVWEGRVQLSSLSSLQPSDLMAGQQAFISKGIVRLESINAKAALANAFTEWNLRLQRPAHPSASGPLLRPTLVQSAVAPTWVDVPQPAPSPQSRVTTPQAPVAAATPREQTPVAAARPRTQAPVAGATPREQAGTADPPRSQPAPTLGASAPPSGPRVTYATPVGPRVAPPPVRPPTVRAPSGASSRATGQAQGPRPRLTPTSRTEAQTQRPYPQRTPQIESHPRFTPQSANQDPRTHPRWTRQNQAASSDQRPRAQWSPQTGDPGQPHPRFTGQGAAGPRWQPQHGGQQWRPQQTSYPGQAAPSWTPREGGNRWPGGRVRRTPGNN